MPIAIINKFEVFFINWFLDLKGHFLQCIDMLGGQHI
jgi:hypothetical protein